VAAVGAPAVVQDAVIDNATEDGADLGAQGAAAQATEHDTDDSADRSASRTGCHTDGEADARAAKRTGNAASGTCQAAERAAGSLGDVAGFDAVAAAVGTLKGRQGESAPLKAGGKKEEEKSWKARPRRQKARSTATPDQAFRGGSC
jgi:hypothetical protein